jgi:hypothetical protein
MIVLTKLQRKALFRVFQRDFPSWVTPTKRMVRQMDREHPITVPSIQWRRFRAKVCGSFGCDCVMLNWRGMWLGIEKDGYTHS